jgi:hypothetical protein
VVKARRKPEEVKAVRWRPGAAVYGCNLKEHTTEIHYSESGDLYYISRPGWPDRIFQPTGTIQRPPWTKYFDAPNPPQRHMFSRPRDRRVPMVNTADVAMQQTAVGATADATPPAPIGWGTYALVGLAVGAAGAMVYGATKIKPGRSR